MGYSVWVADDPELADESDEPTPSDFPHYSCSLNGMQFLRQEMIAQGMVSLLNDLTRARLIPLVVLQWNNGWPVLPRQISRGLAKARPRPITAHDTEARQLWREWLRFLKKSLKHGGIIVH